MACGFTDMYTLVVEGAALDRGCIVSRSPQAFFDDFYGARFASVVMCRVPRVRRWTLCPLFIDLLVVSYI